MAHHLSPQEQHVASTKLTNDLKRTIKDKIVDSVFKQDIGNTVAVISQLAYERVMTPQKASLPQFLLKDGWIGTNQKVAINWYKDDRRIDYDYFQMPVAVPVKTTDGVSVINVQMDDVNDGIAVAYRKWKQLGERQNAMNHDVQSVMDSCNTTKQLVEILPAAEPYIPDLARPTALISQDVLDRLNRLLVKEA
jgi:hypothetical protein